LHTFFNKSALQLGNEISQLSPSTSGADERAASSDQKPQAVTAAIPNEVPIVRPRIPADTSPAWQALIEGRIEIDSPDPGLQMMVEKVRRVTQSEPSAEVLVAAARVLRRYLTKFGPRHPEVLRELNRLDLAGTTDAGLSTTARARRLLAPPRAIGGSQSVPDADDPVWARVISGEIRLETDALALRMILDRARRSVRSDPSDANRRAAALSLREYFVKHERIHRAELQRIRAA
jgi:hypothetical protein